MDLLQVVAAGFLILVILIVSLSKIYKRIRPLLPVQVNCWFCNHVTNVPYGNKNCWDCPHCEQYNGFNEDGDYNKVVPAQYNEDINHPIRCCQTDFLSRHEFLCTSCQRNQLLKIKQLASFEPLNETKYDEEIAFYQRHLEKVYALCPSCEATVQVELARQDNMLRNQNDKLKLQDITARYKSSDESSENMEMMQPILRKRQIGLIVCTLITLCCAVCATCLFLCTQVPHCSLIWWENICRVLEENLTSPSFCVCGLVFSIFSKVLLGKERLYVQDPLHIIFWLGLLLLSISKVDFSWLNTAWCGTIFGVSLVVLEITQCLQTRYQTNATSPIIKRLSLDISSSSNKSDTTSDAVSSVSTSCRQLLSSSSVVEGYVVADSLKSSRDKKPEVDVLGKDFGSFNIGCSPASDSGYSTNSSAVFDSRIFTSKATSLLQAGVPFPRPLIAPARLSYISFTQPPYRGNLQNQTTMWNKAEVFSNKNERWRTSSHQNPFLAQGSRPHSIFQHPPSASNHFASKPNYLWKQTPHLWTEISSSHYRPFERQKLSWWRDISENRDSEEELMPRKTENSSVKNSVECDSTTPGISHLLINGNSAKYNRKVTSQLGRNHAMSFETDFSHIPTELSSTHSHLPRKQGFSFWWILLLISFIGNIFLAWAVWAQTVKVSSS